MINLSASFAVEKFPKSEIVRISGTLAFTVTVIASAFACAIFADKMASCVENGLSIVENPKPHGKSYNKWLGDQAKPSHRELLRVAIDNALSQSPTDFEALLKLLQESGCEVSKRGKSYRLKLPGWEKAARKIGRAHV